MNDMEELMAESPQLSIELRERAGIRNPSQ